MPITPFLKRIQRSVAELSTTLKDRLDNKLDRNAPAVDSQRLEGKSLDEVIEGLSESTLGTTDYSRILLGATSPAEALGTLGARPAASRAAITLVGDAFTPIASVTGIALASMVRLSIKGTGNNVVINTTALIIVGHSKNIYVHSESGGYTSIQLKIDSDNASFTVSASFEMAQSPTNLCYVEIVPYNGETITLPDTEVRYSLTTHTHTTRRHGVSISATGHQPTPDILLNNQLVYKQDNILGAVGFANGRSTGAIIERGSNTNGEYVRFADGTQICTTLDAWWDLTVATAGVDATGQWIYPAAFINRPHISPFIRNVSNTHSYSVAKLVSNTVESLSAEIRLNASSAQIYRLSISAIGRWR